VGESAEELRRDIEHTRDNMGYTLDAIGDRVSPGRIMERRRNRIVGGFANMRDAVMGSVHEAGSALGDHVSGTRETLSDGASGLAGNITHSPDMARRQARGNPFAAGVIAFGGGLLLAALIPPSEPERQIAQKVRDAAEPLVEPAQDAARQISSAVQESGQEAVGQLKETAASAAQSVKDTAAAGAQETKDAGQSAAQQVQATS
jgi:hypothetical protein